MSTVEVIYVVNAYERVDGIYVFRNESDAEKFVAALDTGNVPNRLTRETVCHKPETAALIEAEQAET